MVHGNKLFHPVPDLPCLLPRVLFLSVCGLLSRQLKLVMGKIVFIIREEKQRAYLLQTTIERRKIK
jgi:hypothetical protein